MITAFVHNYLTDEGLAYYDEAWVPAFKIRLSTQPGFVALEAFSADPADPNARRFALRFESKALLDAWVADEDHDQLIADIRPHRSAAFYNVLVEGDHPQAPASLDDWNKVELRK